jgi:cell division protein ZapD
VTAYEFPLVERIRTLMRLEDLWGKTQFFMQHDEPRYHHAALAALFETIDVGARGDVKSDLLQELERQRQTLTSFRGNLEVFQERLDGLLERIGQSAARLGGMTGKAGQHVRDNEWLLSVKSRMAIPGGSCEFDLPSYHHWLSRDAGSRKADLQGWVAPLAPIADALAIVLELLREGGRSQECMAKLGNFQHMMGGKTALMARVALADNLAFIPEVSANKYALMVRFTTPDGTLRPKQATADIPFTLTFCSF